MRSPIRLATALAAVLAVPAEAGAQYFGQNQVEYESFNFQVLRTPHFDVYYYPEEEGAAGYAALIAERAYARVSKLLDHELSSRQPLILYASGPQFRQTNVVQESGEGTGGVTEILKRRIVMPFAGPLKETDHVLTHELVHAFQFDMTGAQGGVLRAGGPAVQRFPLWFVEGMAEYLSIGPEDANTTMWMRDAVRANKLPNLGRLEDPRFFPYRYGQALWAYIAGRWGDPIVGKILKASRRTDLRGAFEEVLHMSADSIVKDWQQATKQAFAPLQETTKPPVSYGRGLIVAGKESGGYNVAPVLSPDGSKLVFLSSRDLFSIDMYLADAKTGQILKRVVRTDVDPHFESIQFISSAGAWNAAGDRFVFAAIRDGRPVLSILNLTEDKIEREIALPSLGEVLTPTWSPDGNRIAFSALVGGLSDLYVYDLPASRLTRLTDDAYADLQPAWSPDGRYLAWVTDRYSTKLNNLAYGNYRLGLWDVAAGTHRELPSFTQGKHINPQWSPDGRSLYFVSDQNGISNIYRVELASGQIAQLTNLYNGASGAPTAAGGSQVAQVTNLYAGTSGITDLSPTLSVAQRTGQLAFSVYTQDGYSIYVADSSAVLAGQPVTGPPPGGDPAMLPPRQRNSEILTLKANAFYGLPSDTAAFRNLPYSGGLGLDYISQPSLAVGADRFGTYIGGGASLFWSDMLGGHQLATAVQFNGTARDISALVGFSNTYHRLNWGVAVQQIPYLIGQVGYRDTVASGVPLLIQETDLFRQTSRQASWVFAYPFSRVRRIEGSVGFSNISYNLQAQNLYIAPNYQVVDERHVDLGSPFPSLNLGQGSLAMVYDNAIFGFTSPILGQRYRTEVGAIQGSLSVQTVLVDYRKYVMPARPFTLAARIMHYGRYGTDAESGRLQRMYLGYDGLIRGYSYSSFNFFNQAAGGDCASNTSCPAYTNLFGSKMVLGNLELRFPPLGVLHAGGPFGFLPLEMFGFVDGGLAYNTSSKAENAFFLGGDRQPVYSAGAGLRFNFFGFVIVEADLVHPFDRPRGTHWQFTFTPGF